MGFTGLAAGYAIGVAGNAVWSIMVGFISLPLIYDTGCTSIHAAIPGIRRYGVDTDFW